MTADEIMKKKDSERNKKWYQKNKEHKAVKSRENYLANKEKKREGNKKWLEEHPGYHKEWYKKNQEKVKARSRAAYYKKKGEFICSVLGAKEKSS